MDRRTDGKTDRRTDGQTDRRTDGQTDRRTDELIRVELGKLFGSSRLILEVPLVFSRDHSFLRSQPVGARTTGYLFNFPATSVPSTFLRGLHRLMSGVENQSVPGLRATSQNILWSMTKVNEACAWPPHVT